VKLIAKFAAKKLVIVLFVKFLTSQRVLHQKSVLLAGIIVLNVIPIAAKLANKAFGYKTRQRNAQLAVKIANSVTFPQVSVPYVLRGT
jgi:hypothetical protein